MASPFTNAELDALARAGAHLPTEQAERFLRWAARTRLDAEMLRLCLSGKIRPDRCTGPEIEFTR